MEQEQEQEDNPEVCYAHVDYAGMDYAVDGYRTSINKTIDNKILSNKTNSKQQQPTEREQEVVAAVCDAHLPTVDEELVEQF